MLTKDQIRVYAVQGGFSDADADTAVAIALAESNGNPRAYNPETAAGTAPGYGSYGLWQIYLKAHPNFLGSNLYDPSYNAVAAYAVFREQGWDAWSTYKTGAYKGYL